MAEQGKHGITWCNTTWNPIRGCSRVSEGCRNCYAERTAGRFSKKGEPYEGLVQLHDKHEARWTGKILPVIDNWHQPLHWKRPRLIFVNSMSDMFHEGVKDEWLYHLFAVMGIARQHKFQILTKRAERMRDFCNEPETRRGIGIAMLDLMDKKKSGWRVPDGTAIPVVQRPDSTEETPAFWAQWPLPNIWMGVSAEDQKTADERIPFLLQTPATVRWVSYEPALGPVDFSGFLWKSGCEPHCGDRCSKDADCPMPEAMMLDWVVCGGESGPGARPISTESFARAALRAARRTQIHLRCH